MQRPVAIVISIIAFVIFAGRNAESEYLSWLKDATDTQGMIILAVGMLPWLGSIFKSFKINGFGEAQFRNIEKRVSDAENVANQAIDTANDAENLVLTPRNVIVTSAKQSNPSETLRELAKSYVDIRKDMKSGNERTTKMGTIFRQMMEEANKIGKIEFDLESGLRSNDSGEVLASIAYSFVFPFRASVGDLLRATEKSKHPFIQYWGLRSVQNILSSIGISPFSTDDIGELRELINKLRVGTDRYYLVQRINEHIAKFLRGDG